MTDKVFGLTESKVQELVQKHHCIINRTDLVPIVSVEWLEKEIKQHFKILDECYVAMEDPRVRLNQLLEAVRKEALK